MFGSVLIWCNGLQLGGHDGHNMTYGLYAFRQR